MQMRIEQWGDDYRLTQSAEDQDSAAVHYSIDCLGLGRGDFGVSTNLPFPLHYMLTSIPYWSKQKARLQSQLSAEAV